MLSYAERHPAFESLLGKTFSNVSRHGDVIRFDADDGEIFALYHQQYCCESVYIESIVGALDDLIGSPILRAEAVSNEGDLPPPKPLDDNSCTYTWTFYKLATIKGSVDIRLFGESNGCYAETAELELVEPDQGEWLFRERD